MTMRTRFFTGTWTALILLAGIGGQLPAPTPAFAQANGADPHSAITRESLRRAVSAIDIGEAASPANAQSDADWSLVARVKTGADTRVILDDQRVYRGRLQSADERSVTLEIDGVNRTLQRAQVRKVDARGGASARVSKARVWGVVGMIGGLAAGTASCRGKEGECMQGPPLTGMMFGWIAGTIVGAALPTWRSIYSRPPASEPIAA